MILFIKFRKSMEKLVKNKIRNFVAKHLIFGGQGAHVDKAGNKAKRATQKSKYKREIKDEIAKM